MSDPASRALTPPATHTDLAPARTTEDGTYELLDALLVNGFTGSTAADINALWADRLVPFENNLRDGTLTRR